MVVTKVALGTAPMMVSFFSPPLNIMTVGILRIPYSVAVLGLSSVFSFTHRTLPTYSFASSSTIGAIIRQGPHHGAQKSTSTGISHCNTISFHVLSVTSLAGKKKNGTIHYRYIQQTSWRLKHSFHWHISNIIFSYTNHSLTNQNPICHIHKSAT